MVRATLWFGAILTLFGIASYAGTGGASLTALTPVLIGIPIMLLGVVARDERRRKGALGVAAALGLLGLLGTLGGLSGVISALLLGGKEIPPLSIRLQAVMAVLCALFIGLYARDSMQSRRTVH